MSTGPERCLVDARGLPLAVWRHAGPPRGPRVVIQHGFLDHARSFDKVAEALTDRAEVLAIDARGHGASGWVGRGGYYHFPDYVADLHGVLAKLADDDRPLVLVGHSMGGMIVSMYAGAFPGRAASLVLFEGFGPPAEQADDMPARVRQWIEEVDRTRSRQPKPLPDAAAAAARLRQSNPRLREETAARLVRDGTVPVENGGLLWAFDPLHRTRSPQPFLLAQAEAFWRNISCPTTLVVAEHSDFRWNLAEIRRAIPQAALVELPGCGHMMHHEDPDAVAAIIRKALP